MNSWTTIACVLATVVCMALGFAAGWMTKPGPVCGSKVIVQGNGCFCGPSGTHDGTTVCWFGEDEGNKHLWPLEQRPDNKAR